MRPFRFSILQLLLAATLVALVLGLLTSGWRASRYQSIEQICFSPRGEYLAARYSGGAVQVWRLDKNGPRLVARAFGKAGLLSFELGSIHFIGDDKLLKVETQLGSMTAGVEVSQLDLGSNQVADLTHIDSTSPMPLARAATAEWILLADWNSGQLASYSLKSGRLARKWPVASAYPGQSAVAVAGKTLVATDVADDVYVIDLELDAAPIPIRGTSPIAVSGDGRLVATQSKDKPATVCLFDLSAPDSPTEIPVGMQTLVALAITPDNARLVATNGTRVEHYSLATGQREASVELDGMYYVHEMALSANRLARHDGGRIVYYDLSGGKTRYVLGGATRLVEVTLFTLGFAAWSVIWGLVAKRERQRQPAAIPESLSIAQFGAARPKPPVINWKWQLGWLITTMVGVLGVVAVLEGGAAGSVVVALRDGLMTIAMLVSGAIALVIAYVWLAFFIVGPHQMKLARLRRLAGDRGRLYRDGRLSFWFVGQSRIEARYKQHLDETMANAEELFGCSVEPSRYRLIACLDRQCDLDAYFGRHIPISAIIPRYWIDRIGVVCEETAIMHLAPPEQAFRSALAMCIVIEQKRGFVAGWAATLLTQQIARDPRRPAELRGAIRRMKVLLAREPDWDPRRVFLRSARERLGLWLDLDEKQAFREVHAEGDFLLTIGEMLLGADAPVDRRERTLAWLRRIDAKENALDAFERDIGLPLDELVEAWRQWLASRSGLPYDSLPADQRWLLVDVAQPTLDNRELPIRSRQRMIRQLGCFHVTGAKSLIAALSDPKIELRREAAEALEFVSGELWGDNLPQWQAWWQALPATVRGEDEHHAMSRMISGAADHEPVAGIEFGPLVMQPRGPSQPPTQLKTCWALMIAGGVIALVIPIAAIFFAGPVFFPMFYYSLFAGVAAIVHGVARETRRLRLIAQLQLFNVLTCDLINLTFGLVEQLMLRHPHVRQYLLEANGGRV